MPITVASRKGVSAVAAEAEERRIVLTSHGRVVAVVDSAERIDESLRQVREAALAVLDSAANNVSSRTEKLDLDRVCARLGIDAKAIRERASARITAGA